MIRLALIALVLDATPASAQVLYRRPFDPDVRITAGFDTNGGAAGCADYECLGNCYDGHTGTDFGMPVGTPILAPAAGRVIVVMTGCPDTGYVCSPCGGLCGNQVRLEHADGSQTVFCHMQSGAMRVSVGQDVACGQQLGASASSGCSSGPHLHFGFHASASVGADDPFRGACGGPYTRWVDQRPYGELPGTSCECVPSDESCNGADDDCDGAIDDGLARECSTACGTGTEVCSAGSWGACSAPAPVSETCNGADDDCNGAIDDGLARECSTACGAGTEVCSAGSWSACSSEPIAESCNDADDDCDGAIDEELACAAVDAAMPDTDAGVISSRTLAGSCGCRAATSRSTGALSLLLLAAALISARYARCGRKTSRRSGPARRTRCPHARASRADARPRGG